MIGDTLLEGGHSPAATEGGILSRLASLTTSQVPYIVAERLTAPCPDHVNRNRLLRREDGIAVLKQPFPHPITEKV